MIGDETTTDSNTADIPEDTSSNSWELVNASAKSRRRSRYQTVSDEVEGALVTICKELESSAALRKTVSDLHDIVTKLEQTRRIQEGRLAVKRKGFVQSDRDAIEL